jgi:hypothetical protein
MTDFPAHLDRLKRQGLRLAAQVRPRHLAVVASVLVIGVGVAALRAVALPGPQPILEGERLQIQVVAPVEPEVTPGSVMEVGDLVDGFVYTPPSRPPLAEPAAYAPYDEEFGASKPRRAPKRYAGEAVIHAPPQPGEPVLRGGDDRGGRWFGFDEPQRDYRAEREARRARQDAHREQERHRREERRYSSHGPADDRD